MKTTKLQKNGFSLIELIIVVLVIGIIAALAIPNLVKAKMTANESSAVATLRTIHSGQLVYLTLNDQAFFGNLNDLRNQSLIDEVVASGNKSGFDFAVTTFPKTDTITARFDATAIPNVVTGATATGRFSYLIIETGAMYYEAGSIPPTANPTSRIVTGGSVFGN
jgi:type IV pilus assembly protein PilA